MPDSPDSQAVSAPDAVNLAVGRWVAKSQLTQNFNVPDLLSAIREQGWGPLNREREPGRQFSDEEAYFWRAQLSAAQEKVDSAEAWVIDHEETIRQLQEKVERLEKERDDATAQTQAMKESYARCNEARVADWRTVERLERENAALGDKLMAAQVALEMTMEERDEARKQAGA